MLKANHNYREGIETYPLVEKNKYSIYLISLHSTLLKLIKIFLQHEKI
jgi:hypothetical protein